MDEYRSGEYVCHTNHAQVLDDGSVLVLLCCSDREHYVSRVISQDEV